MLLFARYYIAFLAVCGSRVRIAWFMRILLGNVTDPTSAGDDNEQEARFTKLLEVNLHHC